MVLPNIFSRSKKKSASSSTGTNNSQQQQEQRPSFSSTASSPTKDHQQQRRNRTSKSTVHDEGDKSYYYDSPPASPEKRLTSNLATATSATTKSPALQSLSSTKTGKALQKDKARRINSAPLGGKVGNGSSRSNSKNPISTTRSTTFHRLEPDSHPLNLPPDQLRRLSNMSVASAAAAAAAATTTGTGNGGGSGTGAGTERDLDERPTTPMDTQDEDAHMLGTSPKLPSSPAQGPGMANGAAATVNMNASTNSIPNGANGTAARPLVLSDDDGDEDEDAEDSDDEVAPIPPPHGSTKSGLTQEQQQQQQPKAPAVDPEVFKDAGNKFFKAREYNRAIQEYTKGISC